MLKLPSLISLLFFAGAALAQTTQPGETTPSVTPSQTPAVTPSQTPAVIPQSQPPTTQPPTAIAPGGMSQCQNMIGAERDKCLQEEKKPAAVGATGTTGEQKTAPAGSMR